METSRGEFLGLETDFEGIFLGSGNVVCLSGAAKCTFDYNSYQISSPELQDLFLVELVTLLFEALFSFLIPNSQHTLRR